MKVLVIVLIIPFVLYLLVMFKLSQSISFVRMWFSQLLNYFIHLICSSVLVYGVILLAFITASSIIKPLDFNLLSSLDVHINIFIGAWTLSFIRTGFDKPSLSKTV